MMGVKLYKRGSVYWVAIVSNRRRMRRSLQTGDRTVAKRIARDLEGKLALGERGLFSSGAPLIRDYAMDRLVAWKRRLRGTTLHGYELGFGAALPFIGDLRVDELTRADAARLAESLRVGPRGARSAATLRNLLAPLQALYSDATEAGLVIANPFARKARLVQQVAPRASIGGDGPVIPYTRDEQERLLAVIRAVDLEDFAATLLGLRAGMRRSEVLAVRRRHDVDLERREINVNWRWAGRTMDRPKSKNSRRSIPMSADCATALRAVIAKQNARALKRRTSVPELLFPAKNRRTAATTAQEENQFGRRFARYLELAGVERKTRNPFHRLRHTFASELLAGGISIWKVSRWLGHSSIELTNRVYAHWIPRAPEHAAVDALDQGLDQNATFLPQSGAKVAPRDGA